MIDVRNGIPFLIIIYIFISYLIWNLKPKIMFQNGKMKQFGIGKQKSIFNYQIVVIFLAIFLFYFYEIYWVKINNYV